MQARFAMGLKGQELWGGTSQIRGSDSSQDLFEWWMLPEAQKASLYRTETRVPVQKTNVIKQKRGQKRGRPCSQQKRTELMQD